MDLDPPSPSHHPATKKIKLDNGITESTKMDVSMSGDTTYDAAGQADTSFLFGGDTSLSSKKRKISKDDIQTVCQNLI